jgi:GNAT superfamily N-acetyltransferase
MLRRPLMSPVPRSESTALAVMSCRADLRAGLQAVRTAVLYDQGSSNSHVEEILRQVERDGLVCRERAVVDLWLVRDPCRREPVGMAMVTQERLHASAPTVPVLNLFVAFSHRRQGLGDRLLHTARAAHPMLEGHYTCDSLALYQRHGLPDVYRHRLPPGAAGQRALAQRHADLNQPTFDAAKIPVWRLPAEDSFTRGDQRRRRRDRRRG